jgi:small subunit ribosomal protein S8
MNDPIGDFIIRIKNAGNTGKKSVSVPFSKMKLAIAELLNSKGFVGAVTKKTKGEIHKAINIDLLYNTDGSPVVSDVKRISKPSRRLYGSAKNIKQFRRGFGMTVLSTPKGVMADMDAKKANLGGEILFNIW